MNAEDIEMGEWYHMPAIQDSPEYTPLALYRGPRYGYMAFRERTDGEVYVLGVETLEPVPYPAPEPVVFMEQWIVVNSRGATLAYNSPGGAEAATHRHRADSRYRPTDIGILHVRPDGSTEMLEIES
tara:strand:- start:117 stop:497 length:381 start_codon:yes stop_codon:yes gene_type:complete